MYTVVQNHSQLLVFHHIWTEVWREKGFELEYEQEVLDRMIVSNEEGVSVGTFEIKPYNAEESNPIHQIAPFHEQPELMEPTAYVAEVDKVALLKQHRGANISRLLSAMVNYADKHHFNYYICLLEPVFARALRVSFHIPARQIAGRIAYKGDDVIPTIIHVGKIWGNKSDFEWLLPDTQEVGVATLV
jgi:GNAT superfamily N-acetyltransferase